MKRALESIRYAGGLERIYASSIPVMREANPVI
jgi:hypothetical protein